VNIPCLPEGIELTPGTTFNGIIDGVPVAYNGSHVFVNGNVVNAALEQCVLSAGTRNEFPVFLRPVVAVGGLFNKATNLLSENVSSENAQSFAFSGATAFARGYVAEADLSKETKTKVTVALEVAQAAVSGGTSLLTKGLGLAAYALDRVAPGIGTGAAQALTSVVQAYAPGVPVIAEALLEPVGRYTAKLLSQRAAEQGTEHKR
jgi:hypothetical protein